MYYKLSIYLNYNEVKKRKKKTKSEVILFL